MLFTKSIFAVLALSLFTDAHPLEQRSSGPGFLKLDISVVNRTSAGINPSLVSKLNLTVDSTVPGVLENSNNLAYYIDLLIGSNSQTATVQLDTGSSDLWVIDSGAEANSLGVPGYNSKTSTTYKDLHARFSIGYGLGASVSGEYGSEQVQIPNGPVVTDVTFASVSNSQAGPGILGIGTIPDETTSVQYSGQKPYPEYPNFPVVLKNEGFISKVAYSVYLNDLNSSTGAVIFGGVDTAKYESLTTLPIVDPVRLSVNFTSLTTDNGTVLSAAPGTTGVLDTGTSLTYLSDDIVQTLATIVPGGSYNSANGNIVLSGPTLPEGLYYTYDLAGVKIKVPLDELVTINFDSKGNEIAGYALAIASNKFLSSGSGSYFTILGDSFLRSAYVVFDLDDNNFQIGQVKYTTDSNVVAL